MNCPNCNKLISPEDRFCGNCGYKLKQEDIETSKEIKARRRDFYYKKSPKGFWKSALYWYLEALKNIQSLKEGHLKQSLGIFYFCIS